MKSILKLLGVFAMILLVSAGCGGSDDSNGAEIQDNGLSRNINDLVPEETLNTIRNMGMPIYGGGEPPKIEGTYKIAPNILFNSNVPNDFSKGYRFNDYTVEFSDQNNDDLTVKTKIASISGSKSDKGQGVGSFIVGENNQFSVFVKVEGVSNGQEYTTINVYSGILTERGIEGLYHSLFMLDDRGDAKNVLIENGDGRVFYDGDGISERISSSSLVKKESKANQSDNVLGPLSK